ncbi:uncharacterized protein [Cicer arietinum]|uniref:uncharacterized protein n=1 Tax=Cicer arietinum TaxID=3827 RepID=UPI003CC6039B
MTPFEALYRMRHRTPLCWYETGDNLALGPEIVQQTTDKVKMIQEKMRASQRPYQILKCVGNVAYQIVLPPSLSNLHSVFHVSQLHKYIPDPSYLIESDKVVWGDAIGENATWEVESQMRDLYPELFSSDSTMPINTSYIVESERLEKPITLKLEVLPFLQQWLEWESESLK